VSTHRPLITAGAVASLTETVAGKRAAVKTMIYGAVDLSTVMPDVVAPNWGGTALPQGCTSITNLTITNPGGRTGGTSISAQLLVPTATPVGKCLLFCCGHAGWPDFYVATDGSSIVVRMLALGWHILIADMPNYGLQPTQVVVINGATVTQTNSDNYAPKGSTKPFDAPNVGRLFFDHLIIACNWVAANVTNKLYLAGVSGGGSTCLQLACLDDRFKIVHTLQGNGPIDFWNSETTSWIDWTHNDVYVAGSSNLSTEMLALTAAAVPGRISVIHSADADEYHGDQHLIWENWMDTVAPWVAMSFAGSSLAYHRKAGAHSIDSAQAAWVEAHFVANT